MPLSLHQDNGSFLTVKASDWVGYSYLRISKRYKSAPRALPDRLHDPATVGSDGRIGEFSTDGLQGTQRADIVNAHETAIADHVSCKDRG
jgi:hypothetical protein